MTRITTALRRGCTAGQRHRRERYRDQPVHAAGLGQRRSGNGIGDRARDRHQARADRQRNDGRRLLSDNGLGIISDNGLGIISDNGLGMIATSANGLLGAAGTN
jgi:hypothetical protein